MPPIFLAFLIVSALAAALVVGWVVASLLFFVCFGWVVVFFPFRYMRKKKGRAVLVRPRFVGCGFVIRLLG